MNDQQLQHLLGKMQDVYESGKPLYQEIQGRWQQHQGVLSMVRFILAMSPRTDDATDRMTSEVIRQFDQLSLDLQQLLAILMSYQGLTLALMGVAREYREEERHEL